MTTPSQSILGQLTRQPENLQIIKDFLDPYNQETNVYNPKVPVADTYLFCGSDWAVEKAATAVAQDYLGNNIKDTEGNDVTIGEVTSYAKALQSPGTSAWWAGDHTAPNNVYGYYFDTQGGAYCTPPEHMGLTSFLEELVPVAGGGQPSKRNRKVTTVIICGNAFNDPDHKESYQAANTAITEGSSLADAVPRSATLLHEAFHVIFGDGPSGFLGVETDVDPEESCRLLLTNQSSEL